MSLLITRGLGLSEGVAIYRDIASQIIGRVRLKDTLRSVIRTEEVPQARVKTKIYLRGKLTIRTVIHARVIEKTHIIGKIKNDD